MRQLFVSTKMVNPQPPLTLSELSALIETCPLLHLSRVNESELLALLNRENNSTSDIAAVVQKNRVVASRILRTVNSAYYGLPEPVRDIEEAILYMGLTQIRRIALTTPLLDSQSEFAGNASSTQTHGLWRHGLATAILTQELLKFGSIPVDEGVSHLAGLLHDVGHLVMASISPERFAALTETTYESTGNLLAAEERIFGADHARIGALYIRRMAIPPDAIDAIEHHHAPEKAKRDPRLAGAVLLAEELARRADFAGAPPVQKLSDEAWGELPAWKTVFGNRDKVAKVTANRLRQTLSTLPDLLLGII